MRPINSVIEILIEKSFRDSAVAKLHRPQMYCSLRFVIVGMC